MVGVPPDERREFFEDMVGFRIPRPPEISRECAQSY